MGHIGEKFCYFSENISPKTVVVVDVTGIDTNCRKQAPLHTPRGKRLYLGIASLPLGYPLNFDG